MTPPPPISRGGSGDRTAPCFATALFTLGLYIVGFVVFFRAQILSDFDRVFGARSDTRLVAFIHEHAYRWLQGSAELLSPPFFFNQTKTLGYSDAFLLNQLIYAPLRLFGAEPLLAASLVAMLLSPVAFCFVYLFLRRLDVSVVPASLGAFLFTFPNNLFLKSWHLQHFAVYYIPVIAYGTLVAISDLHRRPVRAYLFAAFAAGLYGLLFSTGYYMAWFFGLGLLIFTPIAVYLAWPPVQMWWRTKPSRVLRLGLMSSLSFLAALSLFAAIYAPVLTTGAGRGFRRIPVLCANTSRSRQCRKPKPPLERLDPIAASDRGRPPRLWRSQHRADASRSNPACVIRCPCVSPAILARQ